MITSEETNESTILFWQVRNKYMYNIGWYVKFNGFLILAFQLAIEIEGGNFGYKEDRIFHIMVGIELKRLLATFAKFLFFSANVSV